MRTHSCALLALTLVALGAPAQAREIYVSATTGKNDNPGTKEAPKKLLWRVMNELQEGDVIRVAEGVYRGQKKSGVMPQITVGKITLEGGWKADFSERDPFKYLSVITGDPSAQADTREVFRFEDPSGKGCPIVIDGFCIDRGPALYYYGKGEGGTDVKEGHVDNSAWGYQAINKKKSGTDPAIELLGRGSFTVRNMILVNNPWWGIYVKAGGDGEVVIENNLIIGYRGRGIEAITGGGWGNPKYVIRNNTVAFGVFEEGRALSLDPRSGYGSYLVEKNVLAFGNQTGFMTKFDAKTLSLKDNLFFGFKGGDAGMGGSSLCNADEFEDELECDNSDNVHALPAFIAKLHQPWVDRWSQWPDMTGQFCSSDEIMAARQSAGLGAYELPFFPGKTYASYAELPSGRINFDLCRYPHPFKQGQELMDWTQMVVPAIGADGARGVQAFKAE